mmetsp:Transcript_11941/g.35666  ORF Transcript_11941/g.35666 Transcript_11941/m.35666 type:complete len:492 (-) Transcript_11941:8-1483(-)
MENMPALPSNSHPPAQQQRERARSPTGTAHLRCTRTLRRAERPAAVSRYGGVSCGRRGRGGDARRVPSRTSVALLLLLLLGRLPWRLRHSSVHDGSRLDRRRLGHSLCDRRLDHSSRPRRLDLDLGSALPLALDHLAKAPAAKALGRGRLHRRRRAAAAARHLDLHLWRHRADGESRGGGDDVVGEPVEAEPRRDVEREPADHQGQKLEDGLRLRLGRVVRLGREQLHRRVLREHEQHRQHEVGGRVCPPKLRGAVDPLREPADALLVVGDRSLKRGQPEEGLLQLVLLGEEQQGAVQPDEERDLREGGQAAGERIHLVVLVELLQLDVEAGGVAVAVLLLQRLGRRPDGLHLLRRLDLLLGQRKQQQLDAEREDDDGGAVAGDASQLLDRILKGPDDDQVEPALLRGLGGCGASRGGSVVRQQDGSIRQQRGEAVCEHRRAARASQLRRRGVAQAAGQSAARQLRPRGGGETRRERQREEQRGGGHIYPA